MCVVVAYTAERREGRREAVGRRFKRREPARARLNLARASLSRLCVPAGASRTATADGRGVYYSSQDTARDVASLSLSPHVRRRRCTLTGSEPHTLQGTQINHTETKEHARSNQHMAHRHEAISLSPSRWNSMHKASHTHTHQAAGHGQGRPNHEGSSAACLAHRADAPPCPVPGHAAPASRRAR